MLLPTVMYVLLWAYTLNLSTCDPLVSCSKRYEELPSNKVYLYTCTLCCAVRDLHGNVRDLSDSSSESSEESEDEEGAWPAEAEAEFLKTLSLLKNKDPRIYDPNTTFYSTLNDAPASLGQRSKAMYLRDYERERLLEKGRCVNSTILDLVGVTLLYFFNC